MIWTNTKRVFFNPANGQEIHQTGCIYVYVVDAKNAGELLFLGCGTIK